MKIQIAYKKVFIIILISSLIGVAFNFLGSKGIELIRSSKIIAFASDTLVNNNLSVPQSKLKLPGQTKDTVIRKQEEEIKKPLMITLRQAFKLYAAGAMFIDARDKWDFGDGHIKGAINIPHYNFDPNSAVVKSLPKQKAIVTYCGGDDCEASTQVANELFKLGYKKIYIFFGGWNEWIKAEYEIEKGEVSE